MAHVAKYTRSDINKLVAHDERSTSDKVKSRRNENIDPERTHLNYAFESVAERDDTLFLENYEEDYSYVEDILGVDEEYGWWDSSCSNSTELETVPDTPEVGHKYTYMTPLGYVKAFGNLPDVVMSNRKDLKAVVSWVVTMPEKVTGAEQERFFEETYAFLRKRYCDRVEKAVGMSPVISAVVHLDETTPHMHFKFIPTYYDKKAEKWRVSAKEVLNRRDLQGFHKDLSAHMAKVFGRNIGIENGATRDGNKTVEELKRQEALENDLKILEQRVNALRTNEKALESALQNNNEELQVVEKDLAERLVDLSAVKSELDTLLIEIKTLREGIADIQKLSERTPKTEHEWQERFRAVPRKLGKGYVVEAEQLEKASKTLAKQEKQLIALSAEIKSLQQRNDSMHFGYETPLQKVEKARKFKELDDTVKAYKEIVEQLPPALRQSIEHGVRERLHPTRQKSHNKDWSL